MNLAKQIAVITAVAVLVLIGFGWKSGDFWSLWLTPDQQGRRAYENLQFADAAEKFEDPAWKGTAEYAVGRYVEAAGTFGRIPTAVGFYNRGNAFLKGREYAKAITAYEQAVAEEPDWTVAAQNLELATYILDYIENVREQSDTGDESELGADEYKYDKKKEGGTEMVITEQSTIELASAEKWMRTVDTETRDFLRTRFELEARNRDAQ